MAAMSMRYSYYVGPYIETVIEMVEVSRTRRACTKERCSQRDLFSAFCPLCGSAVVDVPYTAREPKVSAWRLSESLGDALWPCASGKVWTPNVRRNPPREFDAEDMLIEDEHTNAGCVPLEGLAVAEKAWLSSAFEQEIATLAKHYGAGNVTVKWGLVWSWG